jgi:hypothetical protein
MLKLGSQWIGALRAKLKKWRPAVILKTRGNLREKEGIKMRKIVTFVMLISLFSFGYMVPNSYAAMEPVAKGLSSPNEVGMLTGSPVVNGQEEYLGTIHDFVIDRTGRISFAILSHGGFLGIGRKLAAIPFGALSYDSTEDISSSISAETGWDRRPNSTGPDSSVLHGLRMSTDSLASNPTGQKGIQRRVSPTMEEESMKKEIMEDFPSKEEGSLGEYQYFTWP